MYPIPPAGADPATYRSEEEPPPLGFAHPFPQDLALLQGDNVQVLALINASAWRTPFLRTVFFFFKCEAREACFWPAEPLGKQPERTCGKLPWAC